MISLNPFSIEALLSSSQLELLEYIHVGWWLNLKGIELTDGYQKARGGGGQKGWRGIRGTDFKLKNK